MNRTEIEGHLTQVREARKTWGLAHTDFFINIDRIMRRLIHEGIANRMSVDQMAILSGVSVKHIRELMRTYDLDPKGGKQMLSRKAAEALANNAELLGIEPREMDLMSPLAYLPAGSELRKQMAAQSVSQVTEVSGNVVFVLVLTDNPEGPIFEGVFASEDEAKRHGFEKVQEGKGEPSWIGTDWGWRGINEAAMYGSRELELYRREL